MFQIPTIDYNRDVCKEKYERVLEYIGEKLPEHAQPADVLIEKVRELFRAVGTEEKLDIGAVTEDELKKICKRRYDGCRRKRESESSRRRGSDEDL